MENEKYICIISAFALWMLSSLFLESSEAAMCAFRNPDRDVYIMFPEATGYQSVIKTLDKKTQEKVAEYLGQKLDFDEIGEFTFYLILKDKDIIGIIRPHAERGKYGVVEMVWAFTLDGKIIDYKVQRSRERNTKIVKSEQFRRQFKGKKLNTAFTETKSKNINTKLFKVSENSEKISSVIAYSAKKNLFLYKLFFPEYIKDTAEDSKGEPKQASEEKGEIK